MTFWPGFSWTEFLCVTALTVIVSALAIVPFFYIGEDRAVGCCGGEMPVTHDLAMHLNQMQGFHRGLGEGRIFPRWQDETRRGFGAPTTIFYPPAIYYLTSLLYFLFGDWMTVIKALYLLLMIGSGLAFYRLARRFLGLPASILGIICYLIAPYHLINHYQRGAIAECLGFILLPLAIAFAWDIVEKRPLSAIPLSLCWGVFIFSHPPTAYQLALIWGPIVAVFLIRTKQWRAGIWIASALLIGTMLAGSYILPAVLEQKEIHAEDVEESWPYHESYVYLMSSAKYNHRADDFIARIDQIWLFSLAFILIAGLFIALGDIFLKRSSATSRRGWFRRGPNRQRVAAITKAIPMDPVVITWLTAGVVAGWMMTVYSQPVGRLIPKIEIGVFSWRLLAQTSMVAAMLVGIIWERAGTVALGGDRRRGRIMALIAIMLVVATGLMSYTRVIRPMYRAEAFRPVPEHSNFATAPRATPRVLPQREAVVFLNGGGKAETEWWDTTSRRIVIRTEQTSKVSIRTSNYPGWTAQLNRRPIPIETGLLGEITITVPPGSHHLALDFVNTSDRRIGNVLTICAALLLAVAVIFSIVAQRRQTGDADEQLRQTL